MVEEVRPLQATFDIENEETETVEGTGFEPGTMYTLLIEREPRGTFMQYGKSPKKNPERAGLYTLSNKTAGKELAADYYAHPDRFEIFAPGLINGQQALVAGKDYEKFKPYLTRVVKLAFKCEENSRLVFMDLPDASGPVVNESHPEWESVSVRLARKFGESPKPKTAWSYSFLHPGVRIKAQIVMVPSKVAGGRDQAVVDIETIELASDTATPQKTLPVEPLDPAIQAVIIEVADGCKGAGQVFKKAMEKLIADKAYATLKDVPTELKGKYYAAISAMKASGDILA
jgi:hypothetical protein